MTNLILYTKPQCHLCNEMKAVIARLNNEIEFEFKEVDIEGDPGLFERYKTKIPVLMIDGRIFAKYAVDEKKLRRKLNVGQ